MNKYFVIADKKFKNWELLKDTLYHVTGNINAESFEFYAYDDVNNLWDMLNKYRYWYNVNVKNANDIIDGYIDEFIFIIFYNGKNKEIKNILKLLKKERIKPLLINY